VLPLLGAGHGLETSVLQSHAPGPQISSLACHWEGMWYWEDLRMTLAVLQVVQPDTEEAGRAQGAGEGAHVCGDCC
jgi:uncharacterized protein (DUF2249 family)